MHRLASPFIALNRQFADFLCSQCVGFGIFGWYMGLHPMHHGRTGGKRFPAAAEAAQTKWPRRIDEVMPDFWVRLIHATVDFAVEENTDAYAGADSHINQA